MSLIKGQIYDFTNDFINDEYTFFIMVRLY